MPHLLPEKEYGQCLVGERHKTFRFESGTKVKHVLQTRVCLLAAMLLSLFGVVEDSVPRPEFAAQFGSACGLCHINPTGGGPRNGIGHVFEDNDFVFPDDFNADVITAEVDKITGILSCAIDIRTAYIKTTKVDHSDAVTRANCGSCHSSVDSFYMMQGELTVNVQASEKVNLTASNNMGTTLNMFATIDAVPKYVYVKVGQFRIPFGIKHNDHNMLLRQGYNLGSNKREIGVEVGGAVGKAFYNAAIFNGGNFTIFNGGGALPADSNQNKGWTATFGSAVGPLRVGMSYLSDKPVYKRTMVAGAFLTVAYKGVSIEGEVNFGAGFEDEQKVDGEIEILSRGYYVGTRSRVVPNLVVSMRYESFDPDRGVRRGDMLRRISGSARYGVTDNASLELFFWGNLENEDRAPGALGRQLAGVDQVILMSHFWF